MGSDSLLGVEPPRDAEGRKIPLDTEVLYRLNGEMSEVAGFVYWSNEDRWVVIIYGSFAHYESSDFLLFPPDAWEKLEEDAKKVKACDYAHAPRDEYGITVCRDCRFQKSKSCRQEMILDIIARAKKLAGIEEEQR